MFQFLQPILALGLLGILVPLALHWWNKRQQTPILVGSTQFMTPSSERRIRSLEFKDFYLWLLRVMLLVLFTLLLMEPVVLSTFSPEQPRLSKWVIIAPKIYESGRLQATLDSLEEAAYEIRLLADQFPLIGETLEASLEEKAVKKEPIALFSSLKAIEKVPNRPDTVLLFAYPTLQNLQGARPELNYVLKWSDLPGEATHHFIAQASLNKELLEITFGSSNEEGTQFEVYEQKYTGEDKLDFEGMPTVYLQQKEKLQAYLAKDTARLVNVIEQNPLQLQLVYNKKYQSEQQIILAALQAIKSYQKSPIGIQQFNDDQLAQLNPKADWTIWLSDKQRKNVDSLQKGHWLLLEDAAQMEWPIASGTENGVYFLQKDLDPLDGDLRAARLPAALLQLFYGQDENDFIAADIRRFPQGDFTKIAQKEKAKTKEPLKASSLHFTLWILLLILFVIERFVANAKSKSI